MGKLHKIVYMPLDERPCNYQFPYLLAQGTGVRMARPPMEMMGLKKGRGTRTGYGPGLRNRLRMRTAPS